MSDGEPWWMRGNFAPIRDERTVEELPVEGEVPEALAGLYVRVGFNPPGAAPLHWFFGAGMVHAFEVRDGRVSYRNRYVRTPYLENGLDPFSAMADLRASPANTHVIRHAGRILALEETHLPWQLGARMETVGCFDFDGRLTTPMTAHPKICPVTGELFFFGYQFLSEPYLTFHQADPSGRLVRSEVIDIPRPVMMHDFAITRDDVVFLDLPIVFSMAKGGFRFERACGARIGVMPRRGGNADVRWFEIEPCTVFHVVNAYRDGDLVVLHACRAPSLMERGMNDLGEQAVPWRWTIDTVSGRVTDGAVDDRLGDFPRVDDRRVGLRARYGYLASLERAAEPVFGAELRRYDLETGAVTVHQLRGAAAHAFEPVFAPAHRDAAEDEGWVLALSHDDASGVTALNFIDARDFGGRPVARAMLPRRVPFGAHGSWLPDP